MLKRLLLTCAIAFALLACKEEKEVSVIRGITVTNEIGVVLHKDPDDWRDTKNIKNVSFSPNPFVNPNMELCFTLLNEAHCWIWIVNEKDYHLDIIADDLTAGRHCVSISEFLDRGLYRVYIIADKELTYGDIQSDRLE